MADAVGDGLEERERVALARAEELRVELERPGAVVCRPLDRIPEVHHPLGGGEAVIPDAPFYDQRHTADCTDNANRTSHMDGAGGADETDARGGVMLRAFVEVDRATKGPERLAAKPSSYARPHSYAPAPVVRQQQQQPFPEPAQETWRQRYPLFPRLLFILDSSGPAWVENRINALRAASRRPELAPFLSDVPVLAAPRTDGRCVGAILCARAGVSRRSGRAVSPPKGDPRVAHYPDS
ncbi:hypothetical protein [Streptomyces sp. NA02536]|uniref:hypothetical protein n=1 Tax=Streptomyces sp. NA02536 TaxID=2742133 RepID=UPI00159186CD|nr:hypothetical protein [Streptomyces sp. NA02536]QKV98386.1 hypothetical protein HUT14_00200 [Streptomyces sp. NA02536]